MRSLKFLKRKHCPLFLCFMFRKEWMYNIILKRINLSTDSNTPQYWIPFRGVWSEKYLHRVTGRYKRSTRVGVDAIHRGWSAISKTMIKIIWRQAWGLIQPPRPRLRCRPKLAQHHCACHASSRTGDFLISAY